MTRKMVRSLAFLVLLGSLPRISEAQERNTVWTLGLSLQKHRLSYLEEDIFHGTAATVKFGKGYLSNSWMSGLSLDILAGPHESPESQDVDVDFTGTGVSGFFAYKLIGESLRSNKLSLGLLLSFSYADIAGRSVGQQIESTENPDPINGWVMRVNNFSGGPSIFISWLKPPRPSGNTPELLMTRLEGFVIQIGVFSPALAKYKLEYELITGTEKTKGELYGRTYFISIDALFGS